MVRRLLLVLTVSLAVGIAPVVAEVCHVVCIHAEASAGHDSAGAAEPHVCHEVPVQSNDGSIPVLAPQAHVCGHVGEVPSARTPSTNLDGSFGALGDGLELLVIAPVQPSDLATHRRIASHPSRFAQLRL